MSPVRLALFASGSGSNAENICHYFSNRASVEVALILSNRSEAFVHQRASRLGVPSVTLTKAEWSDSESIMQRLREHRIDFIVLAGFLLKIPEGLIREFSNRMVNIHPALLPKFGGKGMYGDRVHEAVVTAGEKESGITIHYVNENYDEGAIIFQARCAVLPSDTPHDVADKVHALEYEHFPRIIEEVLAKTFGDNR